MRACKSEIEEKKRELKCHVIKYEVFLVKAKVMTPLLSLIRIFVQNSLRKKKEMSYWI